MKESEYVIRYLFPTGKSMRGFALPFISDDRAQQQIGIFLKSQQIWLLF